MKFKMVPPNEDKPHRCPRCHKIPKEAREDGAALQGKKYYCYDCMVEWVAPVVSTEQWKMGIARNGESQDD
jgi:hypothetical protein